MGCLHRHGAGYRPRIVSASGARTLTASVRRVLPLVASAASVALVTAVIGGLKPYVPVLSLGVLYVFAVLAAAVLWGIVYALGVAIASMLAFNWYYLPPGHGISLRHPHNWLTLSVYAVTAVVVSGLAARARQRAETSEEARGRLEGEQAALRRVATLVARGVPPAVVFSSVAEEVGRLLNADVTHLVRCEPDVTVTVVAAWNQDGGTMPVGDRWTLEDRNIPALVLGTGHPARIDDYAEASGSVSATMRELGIRSSVGCPIAVQGRRWGAVIASSARPEPLPEHTESRLAEFAELVATAIANSHARSELDASRARIVAAADGARKRIERDLHDGIQQRLVALALELRAAEATVSPDLPELRAQLVQVAGGLVGALDDLREISQGIHPAILAEGGLGPALKSLARRSAVPVELRVRLEIRLPEHVEVAAYYVVSEALANVAKHGRASAVGVSVAAADGGLHVSIRDDGIGGADPARGSGLTGLTDRVEALGGRIAVLSPVGQGTSVVVELPFEGASEPGPDGLGRPPASS
jgi:signal transduction histidine kinase